MIYITRRERFNAAHRLFKPDFTDDQNLKLFGKCSNPNWHGHNYDLHVTIKGEVNPETGFLVNLSSLSSIIRKQVIDKLDHRNINLDVDFMQGKYASTEMLAISIWEQLEPEVKKLGALLHRIRVQESENNYVEFFG
ncbi:MAG TPA: 6-pyruvoyl tetrahydrobiopterin synthase [Bacteroidales bacterium]|nr:MAG: 6-pyruvoyl tetrahydrobiopterin synthase [Bacteroidetes bacterium GWE2_42_24]OFY26443.1 MAG: 6-pyruvoyl tetrahydrobiopterin synthase [Bacteroidetes bacterium GWF2_43_11]PKP25741.1 MAG: 6-pyruvoyl tetrahydrobiopterin synthase [Bacteroidetes bacterium HGW-Bacteroidetes-22]HAQ65631.1 6-pyruvoyl tetrahydrobiopterin synthase [Bacteroidales bacterium]HBZ68158.1 6-pyruvoyl tetrahydrobiopterin synthase [Bacteroidales bacterium]